MRFIIYIMAGSLAIVYSCYHENAEQLNKLQGSWIELRPKGVIYFAGSNTSLQFKGDTFYYKIKRYSDFHPKIPCNPELGTEYAKGKYLVEDKKLTLYGYWMLKDYTTIKDTGCCNNGLCMLSFYYKIEGDTFYLNPEKPMFEFTEMKDNLPIIRLRRPMIIE
jgi:hypothetical protein